MSLPFMLLGMGVSFLPLTCPIMWSHGEMKPEFTSITGALSQGYVFCRKVLSAQTTESHKTT
jgi:hypothetical protein